MYERLLHGTAVSAPGRGGLACGRIVHAQALQVIVQRLQRKSEPVLASGQQAAAERDRRHSQPRRACVRVHQDRALAQPPCAHDDRACMCTLDYQQDCQACRQMGNIPAVALGVQDNAQHAHHRPGATTEGTAASPQASSVPMASGAAGAATWRASGRGRGSAGSAVASRLGGGPPSPGAQARRRRLRRPARSSTCLSTYTPCRRTSTRKRRAFAPGRSVVVASAPASCEAMQQEELCYHGLTFCDFTATANS